MDISQLSDVETLKIIEGVKLNIRSDGRTRTQQRPFKVSVDVVPHACGSAYVTISNGNEGEMTCVQTTITAEVERVSEKHFPQQVFSPHESGAGDHGNPSPVVATDDEGRGSMEVHVDCIPTVAASYAKIFSGGATPKTSFAAFQRGRVVFLTHITRNLQRMWGASDVSMTTSGGGGALNIDELSAFATGEGIDVEGKKIEGAEEITDFNREQDDEDLDEEYDMDRANQENGSHIKAVEDSRSCGYNACDSLYRDLYIGCGFAYKLYIDVNISQGSANGLLTAACLGMLAALRTMKLPHVTLIQGVDDSIFIEVDPSKKRGTLPAADVVKGPKGISRGVIINNMHSCSNPIRLHEVPLPVVAVFCGGYYVVDPSIAEELAMPSEMLVGVTGAERLSFVERGVLLTPRPWYGSSVDDAKDLGAFLGDCLHYGAAMHDALEKALSEGVH